MEPLELAIGGLGPIATKVVRTCCERERRRTVEEGMPASGAGGRRVQITIRQTFKKKMDSLFYTL